MLKGQTVEKPRLKFRPWASEPEEDLVSMPRKLALDLVMALAPATHLSLSEEWDPDEEHRLFLAHREKMEAVFQTITAHLAADDISLTPDMALRSIVMTYESAAAIPVGRG